MSGIYPKNSAGKIFVMVISSFTLGRNLLEAENSKVRSEKK